MTADRDATGRDFDAGEPDDGFATIGPAGVPFPSESEWLDADLPTDLADDFADDDAFVQRTMRSLRNEGLADPAATPSEPADHEAGIPAANVGPEILRPEVLAAFRAPTPSPDFVARTLQALAKDRREGFRDLLARHTVPEPSRQFVERTLRALGEERRPRLPWAWVWPVFAAAAAAIVWLVLQSGGTTVDRDRSLQPRRASPFAYSYSPSPLPAVLAAASRRADPEALPDASADGGWMFVGNRVLGEQVRSQRRSQRGR